MVEAYTKVWVKKNLIFLAQINFKKKTIKINLSNNN